MKKYMNVPIEAFLRDILDKNTEHYKSDFDLDIQKIEKVSMLQGSKENKNLLWMSRRHGSYCMSERETFIKGSPENITWKYYDGDESESVKAFAVEVLERRDNVVYGNIYELDYSAHVAEVNNKAVEPMAVLKVFEDGYGEQVPLEISSYGYWASRVEEHGPIVKSMCLPHDEQLLKDVLSEQRRERSRYPLGKDKSFEECSASLDDKLASAAARSAETVNKENKAKDFVKE